MLPKNREAGLPLDEARLSEDEKAPIKARRNRMLEAGKRYVRRQIKTPGLSED